ncbi:sulfurtransferase TusA family protein [Endozoicomonas elysicola]|uniref:Response regulator SirA n=1 Tax=Endozoicomonas elysicola TaxID=305900 RepID=A0A081KE26_9GAMM|nr:sulfurtransferase TusA family protein [Endozoicomonas elysicola]KEI72402.1 response regulator SirA [Endozoicomonas elysicola]
MLNVDQAVDLEIDLKGMSCPLPLLKAKQALSRMQSGQVIRVYATDPGSVRDFASFAKISGHVLVASEEEQGVYIHTLQHK